MGLKRRAAGRKQVLDLTERQDSPRRSWQTKYQQICVEHKTQNGNSLETEKEIVSSTSSKVVKSNPLSGLLANYHSDSDGDDNDDEKSMAKDMDSKVSDFMKEIQTIVPSGSSIVVPGQLITTPGIVDVNVNQPEQQPVTAVSAWQECYDETTGYIYYWHTETNAVTWETPAEYLPQSVSSNQLVDVGHETSHHLGLTSTTHHSGLQATHDIHAWTHPGVSVGYPVLGLNASVRTHTVEPIDKIDHTGSKGIRQLVEYNRKSTDKASSDSEDERIEMITSFGESSDEESEEEIKPPVKKKRPNVDKTGSQLNRKYNSSGKTQDLIGPKLQTSDELNVLPPDSEQVDEGSNLLSNKVDDFGPPGVEMESKIEEQVVESEECITDGLLEDDSHENDNGGCKAENEDKVEALNITSVHSSEVNSSIVTGIELNSAFTPVVSEGEDSTETDEVGILSRLRTQAKVLKELGGELPVEVQQLIEPNDLERSEDHQQECKPEILEKTTALEEEPQEKSQQTESLPDFEKEMERMEEELKQLTRSSEVPTSVESSPKTTSFALIAGYGDDSDQEEESEKAPVVEPPLVQKRTFESLPTVPVKSLFPITEHLSVMEPVGSSSINSETNVLTSIDASFDTPPSPKVSHSILFPSVSNSAEVPLPALRLQEPSVIGSIGDENSSPVEPIIDSTLPKKASKRKKRLDISTSSELVAASSVSKGSVAIWTYCDSELNDAERKGLGFEKLETDADAFLQDCMTEFESKKVSIPKNKESIAFVKGDVLNAPQPESEVKEESTSEHTQNPEIKEKTDEDKSELINDLAQMILEKVTFLAEGKEPPSPVQVMSIQIETLVNAWQIGALSHSYLSRWLGETGDELGRLETSAAPQGWACQWDRSHKRYYYCNLLTGKTQWEYPELPEETVKPENIPDIVEEQTEQEKSPEVRAAEDIAGGELAMEICNTPPHSPSPPPPPTPSPPIREETPPPPPPPTISETKELSPPPPPRISPFSPPKSNERRRLQKGKNKKKKLNKKQEKKQTKEDSPQPPSLDPNPPLPPLPPPLSSPPPPPPSDMPPLPPSPPRQQLAYGEPLPPGVDPGELPYVAHPAPPPIYPSSEISRSPTADLETYQHAMQTTYVMASYQQNMVQSGMAANVQGGAVMDYTSMPYLMHTHMPMPAVIAKPPAKKHKAALHAALNSFYSDLASIAPTPPPEGATTPASSLIPDSSVTESVPATSSEPCVEIDVPIAKQTDVFLKKKKVKKVVGLSLKKKGVSSLVAKWQQVQQEVRRDFETLDEDNSSCQ